MKNDDVPVLFDHAMSSQQFTHLAELVEDIKATGDAGIAAIACRALSDLLRNDLSDWKDEMEV